MKNKKVNYKYSHYKTMSKKERVNLGAAAPCKGEQLFSIQYLSSNYTITSNYQHLVALNYKSKTDSDVEKT